MKYKVKSGDDLYNISKKHGISLFSLIISNPQIINPSEIKIGHIINIPTINSEVINTTSPYAYEVMVKDITQLKLKFPFLRVKTIGKSVLGKSIHSITIGNGDIQLTYNASHHANEWITSILLMYYIEQFAKHIVNGKQFYDFDVSDIYRRATIRIVPMVNPDGVNLVIKGLTSENQKYHSTLLKANSGSSDFSNWNSNIRGVDINHNYDAGWNIYKEQVEPSIGITESSPIRYSGISPESEPETSAMVNFTRANDYRQVMAFHSQGEIIYWDYMNKAPKESHLLAKKYSEVSGYDIAGIAPGPASLGGYKDWFIEEFNRPGFTVEVGMGKNPLPISQFNNIYEKCVKILLLSTYL